MNQFKDYFNSKEEVKEYFKNEVFKFSYMSDNTMCFETLNPVIIDGNLTSFSLSFYYEDGNDFFAYSSFNDWLSKFQISDVTAISESTQERVTMFFRKYIELNN